MTPRCAAAAAVVFAVVLRRPTKEYTHRYSMMHRRLTTAGIEAVPHYHQLLVTVILVEPDRTAHLKREYVQLISAESLATFAGGPWGYGCT